MKLENVKVKDLEDNAIYFWKLDGEVVELAGRFIKRRGFNPEQELFITKREKINAKHINKPKR